jgi:hypothetical protein
LILFIDDCGDVQVLVGIDAADNASGYVWTNLHGRSPS